MIGAVRGKATVCAAVVITSRLPWQIPTSLSNDSTKHEKIAFQSDEYLTTLQLSV
jgi:hypothetical protein